jgi:hypothetical protein
VDTRALDTDVGGDFPKAEAAKPPELHAPFSGVQDCGFDITHACLSQLSVGR